MDRGAWQAMVYQVAKSWTRLKQLHTHVLSRISFSQVKIILNKLFNIKRKENRFLREDLLRTS